MDTMGDHDEGTCKDNNGPRKRAHDAWTATLMRFLKQCGMQHVRLEVLEWSPRGSHTWTNVPDIMCTDPSGQKNYVIDCRIAWKLTTGGAAEYTHTGYLAKEGEREKRTRWALAIANHADFTEGNTEFVPFSAEISGAWGNAAKGFFDTCVEWAGNVRDIDLYTWSSASFRGFWMQALGTCLIRERAKVGLNASRVAWVQRVRTEAHVECVPDEVSN